LFLAVEAVGGGLFEEFFFFGEVEAVGLAAGEGAEDGAGDEEEGGDDDGHNFMKSLDIVSRKLWSVAW
jgi:hypothetical protein